MTRHDLEAWAVKIAHACAAAWAKARMLDHGLRAPLGTIAAMCLIKQADPHGREVSEELRGCTSSELLTVVRNVYAAFVRLRPELTPRAFPLIGWAFSEPDDRIPEAAAEVAQAAVTAGILSLTDAYRHKVDVLGICWTALQPASSLKSDVKFYTPGPVSELMAGMLGIAGETTVYEPTLGCGGAFLAAASVLRQQGRDPATVWWFGQDVDELAVACAAINTVLWDLGPTVVLAVGNSLAEDAAMERAVAERRECLALGARLQRYRTILDLLRGLATGDEHPQGQSTQGNEEQQAHSDDSAMQYTCEPNSPAVFGDPNHPNVITNKACGSTGADGMQHSHDPLIERQLQDGCAHGYIPKDQCTGTN